MKFLFWICSVGFDVLVKVVFEINFENGICYIVFMILFLLIDWEREGLNYCISFIKLMYMILWKI